MTQSKDLTTPSSGILTERRKTLKTLASIAAAAPVMMLAGCGGGSGSTAASSSGSTATGSSGTSTGTGGTSTGTTVTADNGSWLSGGTDAMTASFPDDSIFEDSASCTVQLTGQQTEGPCYFDSDYLDDISEGQTGLPMQLCLQLTDASCNPLVGYEIEVWHCDVEGIYSGDTTGSSDTNGFNSSFCTGNDAEALQSRWFRGIAVTDSSGRVNFATCFPGWYASRAIHIHFRVKNNNNDQLISQFGFDDDFCTEICTSHSDYINHGAPDTLLARDTVFGSDYDEYLFNLEQNEDGSLLAYKRIMISA
ncbi:intradiol ring-cleavage dioxygenase [Alteromonas confluentis]|uniref:Intradiol ring-cleavage dioxygenase n=1 Tax=Alteromonas confluentis TaxID=1656094 RepID=A0A1E7Z8D1_9ALTE|nr:intradiol ring-cleavage dioxygenase [Alteromonas confluentis]OFC69789.1 intradiol ring-cleavage dioxygenase [Alteromonas confluentis]